MTVCGLTTSSSAPDASSDALVYGNARQLDDNNDDNHNYQNNASSADNNNKDSSVGAGAPP